MNALVSSAAIAAAVSASSLAPAATVADILADRHPDHELLALVDRYFSPQSSAIKLMSD